MSENWTFTHLHFLSFEFKKVQKASAFLTKTFEELVHYENIYVRRVQVATTNL